MTRFFSSIQILRPLNMILCIVSVLVAAWLIGGLFSPLLPYTVLVVFFFAGASNILNDVLDFHIDKVNRSRRVLPSGRLSIGHAIGIMGVMYAAGIISAIYLEPLGKQIAFVIVLPLLVLYTPLFKNLPFIGNVVVGILLGLVFIFTEGALNGSVGKMWIPFYLVTTLSTIRELAKDAEDVEGDSIANLQTFPLKFGLIATLWLLRILAIFLCFGALLPWMEGW